MKSTGQELPRPGLVGVSIRVVLGIAVVFFLGLQTIRDTPSFFDGYSNPVGSVVPVLLLAVIWRGVVNELVQRPWGWWPSIVALTGLGLTVVVGALRGDPFGPPYGVYLWTWTLLVAVLLGPAFLLAALLRTPGCEMRSFMDLWARVRGGDPRAVACPGWIDRFDHVRLFGRW